MNNLTTDTFFNGKISVGQTKAGYRYSIDAVILAGCVRPAPRDRILDLGTGCGIIPLIIGCRNPDVRLYGVELQPELARVAQNNVKENGLESRIDILQMDMKDLGPTAVSGPMDMVVCNPPFYRVDSGRVNPDSQRAIARHEIEVSLADVLATAGRLLKTAAKFVCIYRVERLVDLFFQMRSLNIEPKSARTIHSKAGDRARLVLVEGAKGGNPGLTMGPPMLIYHDDGGYTAEIERMFDPEL